MISERQQYQRIEWWKVNGTNEFSRVVVYTIFIIGYSPKGRKIRKGKVLKYKLYRCDGLWYAICILDIGYNRQWLLIQFLVLVL